MVFPVLLCYNVCNEREEVSALAVENGEWIMWGLRGDHPRRIRSRQELIRRIHESGSLPRFKHEIDGFSAEEHTAHLQMGGYLLIRAFRQRLDKQGQPYGRPVSVYTAPETLWSCGHISSAYSTEPIWSRGLVDRQVRKTFPWALEATRQAVLGWDR